MEGEYLLLGHSSCPSLTSSDTFRYLHTLYGERLLSPTLSPRYSWPLLAGCPLSRQPYGRKVQYKCIRISHWHVNTEWPRCLRHELFARSNAGIVGSNPTRGMDVCVLLFCVYAVVRVGRGLARDWSPIQGVIPTVYMITTENSDQGPTNSCRAIEWMNEWMNVWILNTFWK
jgi:hypothetical protein